MSYEIIKGVSIKKGKVFTRQESSNVSPKLFKSEENPILTKYYNELGEDKFMIMLIEGGLESWKIERGSKITDKLVDLIKEISRNKNFIDLSNEYNKLLNSIYSTKDKEELANIHKKIDEIKKDKSLIIEKIYFENSSSNASTYTKLKQKDVTNMIVSGWAHELYYCPSNKSPNENCSIHSSIFMTIERFTNWHNKKKQELCNEIDGKSLKYYIKK